jgi:hypothetical protein
MEQLELDIYYLQAIKNRLNKAVLGDLSKEERQACRSAYSEVESVIKTLEFLRTILGEKLT